MKMGLGIGITKRNNAGGVSFPDNISDPIEKAIVQALGITEAEYNANGIANSVSAWIAADGDVTLDINDHVSLVADKSGNGNDAVPFNEEIEIVAGGLGGKNAFKLVPGATAGGGLDVNTLGFAVNGLNTLMLIFQSDIDDQYTTFSGQLASYYCIIVDDSDTGSSVAGNASVNNLFLNSTEYTGTVNRDQLHDALILNPYTILTIEANFNNWTRLNIAAHSNNSIGLNLDDEWYEALVIPGTLTTQQRESIESAIADKYGITLA